MRPQLAGSPVPFVLLAVCALTSGCHLISGLSNLTIEETTTTTTSTSSTTTETTGSGATGAGGSTGGTATAGSGGCLAPTDVDCGGPDCPACVLGRKCKVNADCESEICRPPAPGGESSECGGVTHITAGNAHACAVVDTNGRKELFCWGSNERGQLGLGDVEPSLQPGLVKLDDVIEVAAGGPAGDKDAGHTCAVTAQDEVYCWGANDSGQLGTNDTIDALQASVTPTMVSAKHVFAGGVFSCALRDDGSAACWGDDQFNQLDDNGGGFSKLPVDVTDVANATELAAGARHACAVSDASVSCWGNNSFGQTGSSMLLSSGKYFTVGALSGVVHAAAGNDATCALVGTDLSCWGNNADSQLGDAFVGAQTEVPQPLVSLPGVTSVAIGADGDTDGMNDPAGGHACAVLLTGHVSCWGYNRNGQLGRGSAGGPESAPAEIAELSMVAQVALGAEFSCARLTTGAARCWGRNDRAQLGTGSSGNAQSSPVAVAWP